MKSSLEGWSLVIAGFWNKMIFQPQWLSKKFFENKTVDIELAIGSLSADPRFVVDNIAIQVTDRKLMIWPKDLSNETLGKVETFAKRVLSELPHTPVQAVGINFKFIEQNPVAAHIEIFEVKDVQPISDCSYNIKASSIQQSMTKEDYTLKLSNTYENNTLTLDFNFNKNLSTAEEMNTYLNGKVPKYMEEAVSLLSKIYVIDKSEIEGLP